MAVTDLAVAIADAAGGPFPYHLAAVGTDLETVAVVPRLRLIAHEAEERHVDWCHP